MKTHTYKEYAAAIRAMVVKLSGTMTDREIADKYHVSVSRIKKARQRLGIKKEKKRPIDSVA